MYLEARRVEALALTGLRVQEQIRWLYKPNISDQPWPVAGGSSRILVGNYQLGTRCSDIHRYTPPLGETYELRERGEGGSGGIRHLGEQVAHHPPVSAFVCQSLRPAAAAAGGGEQVPSFEVFGAIEPRTNFRGESAAQARNRTGADCAAGR